MNHMVTTLFLRIYAMNLRRSWRSGVESAWSDAIYTTDMFVGLPLALLGGAIWTLVAVNWPGSLRAFGKPINGTIIVAVAIWLVVDISLSKKMRRYREEVVSRESFGTNGDRLKVVMAGLISATLCLFFILSMASLHKLH